VSEGRIEQVDAPARLYNQPATIFVAQFIGSPPMNLIEPDRLIPESGIAVPAGAALLGLRPHGAVDDPCWTWPATVWT
jgi:sn-glycerol 3-phosphate transport system ATP-binding protein